MASIAILSVSGIAAATAIAVFATGDYALERRRVNRSLRQLPEVELSPADVRARELAQPAGSRLVAPGLRRLVELVRRVAPAGVVDRLGQHIAAAGSPAGWDAERLFALKVLAGLVGLVVGGALFSMSGQPVFRSVAFACVFAFAGYQAPEWVIRGRAAKRQEKIQDALADALDLLSITVQAGLGFDAAVDRVAEQTGGPLGEELRRLLREMQLGKSRGEALRDLADRNDIQELTSFVLAMVQADSFGIAISRVLDVQADEMRTKRRQRAEERAHKVPVKILFPVLFCIFPSLFLILLGPAVIQLYRNLVA